ncbi:glycoside hydrolase family 99-like domain-containing protein [Hazenella sp. IB182357]|uniref:Glycoside hydrolase family 99-like domain-containing protein n=1 Tax=Polycladospora coralii TaxID=2771432 RepID=A0A926NDQ6_9BACL|nr:glycoside hydrolase family 99-like domain-containing protein [Polycladospora coralii]MBS7531888.1 glycoside hydrolase family 99-like domain-containing protein [Polycladospora coralii]
MTNPQVIAFYLPQFHAIPENNRWWGEGFTEWTNTRKAKPLFAGHNQPREPMNDYYYDLTDAAARKWQAETASRYGVDGFCYYHYWFKGKTLLEAPLQEVLRLGEPDFPFCLSWANEPWTRAWDGMEEHILMDQDYGDQADWQAHFDYLLPAFKDPRYICIEERPVFLIYRPASIPNCTEMLTYWNEQAQTHGLAGIYFVETLNSFDLPIVPGFDASVEFEPMYTMRHQMPNALHVVNEFTTGETTVHIFDYERVWTRILGRMPDQIVKRNAERGVKQTFVGAFCDWDNAARSKHFVQLFHGVTPQKFAVFFLHQLLRAKAMNSPFIFINAWNEWAEGAYLEPDRRFGYAFLEAIAQTLSLKE